MNVAAVPSGTGLLKRSAMRTTTCKFLTVDIPALDVRTGMKPRSRTRFWVGIPVVIVSSLDWVVIVGITPATVAVTRTAVATVPACTTVWTCPFASVMPDAGARMMPPTVVSSEKLTVAPARGPPDVSSTWKMTVEVSWLPAAPVPLMATLVGVAETNTIEPTEAAATMTVPVADSSLPLTEAVAVIRSDPLQPFAA